MAMEVLLIKQKRGLLRLQPGEEDFPHVRSDRGSDLTCVV